MKKYIFLLSTLSIFFACGSESNRDKATLTENSSNLTEYYFKVLELNDSSVVDSIWKMIFTVEGIDQMNILVNDSVIFIKADKSLVSAEKLANEIVNRGGVIQPE